ncbi:MAG: hypothetical protein JXR52_09095 [Bacteroidales bacterium]|nr:hypothetical protein [Bacteroidales bacterium]MBN2698970.1 hypothetical protein [Bacteroidales bacterium]
MKLNSQGLIGTIIYHLLLLILLIFTGLTFPFPPPEEEGILVNFGTDETGFGEFEPIGDEQSAGEPDQPVVEETPEVTREVVETVAPKPVPVRVDHTQDLEETRVKEVPQPTAEEIRKQREEELRKQRELEEERIRQEELRKQQEQADRLSNLGRSTFGKQGVGEEAGSEGEAGGTGNQGVTTGTPDADRYGVGSGLGDGISFGLGSRKAVGNIPKPIVDDCQVTSRMEVEVGIQVDRNGNVVGTIVNKATYQDPCIWDAVLEAAKKTRFTSDPKADYKQTGWIRYIIEP